MYVYMVDVAQVDVAQKWARAPAALCRFWAVKEGKPATITALLVIAVVRE